MCNYRQEKITQSKTVHLETERRFRVRQTNHMIFNSKSSASDLITEYPHIIPLLNRLGIFLGVGNSTLGELAGSHGISESFVTAMVNTYLDKEYFPENELRVFPITELADYLVKTNNYYSNIQLPNIGRHFRSFAQFPLEQNESVRRLYDFFLQLQSQMAEEFERENSVYGTLISIAEDPESLTDNDRETVRGFIAGSDNMAADKLKDLITLLVKHLKGEYDANLCHAVISALSALENDMRQNHRIRDRILSPLIRDIYA